MKHDTDTPSFSLKSYIRLVTKLSFINGAGALGIFGFAVWLETRLPNLHGKAVMVALVLSLIFSFFTIYKFGFPEKNK